jgi:hypothetical protein
VDVDGNLKEARPAETGTEKVILTLNPPVDFQTLVQQNAQVGKEHKMQRVYKMTDDLRKDLEEFKRKAAKKEEAKEKEVRQLQEAMGAMVDENALLKEENESKPSLLSEYYTNVLEKSTSTREMLILNDVPPSEVAVEGALVQLSTMYSGPVEFQNSSQTLDFFAARPSTRFSDQMPTLQSIGVSSANVEHAFFLQCYMRYPVDPSFCKDGHLDNASSVISLPPGREVPPRASTLKCTPRKFRKMFLAQKASQTVSEVSNASLNLSQGGGLSDANRLPIEVHQLPARFGYGKLYKIPTCRWQCNS